MFPICTGTVALGRPLFDPVRSSLPALGATRFAASACCRALPREIGMSLNFVNFARA